MHESSISRTAMACTCRAAPPVAYLPACRCAVRYTVHKYTFDRASQLELGPQGDKQPIPQHRDDAPTAQHANQSQGNMGVARVRARCLALQWYSWWDAMLSMLSFNLPTSICRPQRSAAREHYSSTQRSLGKKRNRLRQVGDRIILSATHPAA